MKRSTIESLVKLPLEISPDKNAQSRKEQAKIVSINKQVILNDAAKVIDNPETETQKQKSSNYSKGYIKYPTYDFF